MPNFVLLLVLFIVSVSAQTISDTDLVESEAVKVIAVDGASFSYGSPKLLEKAYGKAKVSRYPNEMTEGYVYSYKYKGLTVHFWEEIKGKKTWEDMEVTGPNYLLSIAGTVIKIGDHIELLNKTIPLSYKNRADNSISVGIKNKKIITDAYIVITYNLKGRITKIWIGNDNS